MIIGAYAKQQLWDLNLIQLKELGALTRDEERRWRARLSLYPHSLGNFLKRICQLEQQATGTVTLHSQGKTIANHYHLVCETPLGVGGMGSVYPYWDTGQKLLVAVKLTTGTTDELEGLGRRLMREGKILKQLDHPNIVKCYEVGITSAPHLSLDPGQVSIFVAMQYVDGLGLNDFALMRDSYWYNDYQCQQKKLDDLLEKIITYIYHTAFAIDYLHQRGLVHRDIKPNNIIISEETPLLIDFGISQRIEAKGGFQSVYSLTCLGTPAFVDPALYVFAEDLQRLQDYIDQRDWEMCQTSAQRLCQAYKSRTKPLKKFLHRLAWKPWWDFFRRKPKTGFAVPSFADPKWQEMQRIIREIYCCSDPKEDVFSLGVTLYWCLTGTPPFQSPQEGVWCYLNKELPLLSFENFPIADFASPEAVSQTLQLLKTILAKALHPDPNKRITCRQFAEALKPLLGKETRKKCDVRSFFL